MTDRDAIALTLYGEARGETREGRIAVACVLRNRFRSGKWGRTYEAVCLAPKQFSCWNATDPNRHVLLTLAALPEKHHADHPVLAECYVLADVLLAESLINSLGNSQHYYAASIAPPKWAASGELVASVGHHKFFSGVA